MSNSSTECLNCGETRGAVRAESLSCGTVDYFGELSDEFDRHRWADWNDKELTRLGIAPMFLHLYRRKSIYDFQHTPCEHTGKDHKYKEQFGAVICVHCYASPGDTL